MINDRNPGQSHKQQLMQANQMTDIKTMNYNLKLKT